MTEEKKKKVEGPLDKIKEKGGQGSGRKKEGASISEVVRAKLGWGLRKQTGWKWGKKS